MRLIIEITYHSDALAISAERLSPTTTGGQRGKKGRTGWKATYTGDASIPTAAIVCTYAGTSMCEGGSGFIRAHRRATDLNKSFSRDDPRRVCHFISCNFVLDAPRNVTYTCTCMCSRTTQQRVLPLQGRQRQWQRCCIETPQIIFLQIVTIYMYIYFDQL